MIKLREDVDMTGYTLILPSVAVGNVGQLAVDLLISNLNLRKIGQVLNSAFIPIVGADPYDENSQDLCTAVDLFYGADKRIVALQIRSPITKKPTEFFEELQKFIKEKKIGKVVILTSSYGHEKRDSQLRTLPLRYVASPSIISECEEQFKNLNWISLEPKVVDYMEIRETIQIPGGGFAKSLYDSLTQADIPCIILLRFCSEGDNIPDALELTDYANQWMNFISRDSNGHTNVKYPPSWKLLFGNPPPPQIY